MSQTITTRAACDRCTWRIRITGRHYGRVLAAAAQLAAKHATEAHGVTAGAPVNEQRLAPNQERA